MLFTLANCFGENLQTPQAIQTSKALQISFVNSAKNLAVPLPWDYLPLSQEQKQSLLHLEDLAKALMQQPDHAVVLPDLLNQYQSQDGYPRQALLKAVLEGRMYQNSDLPFLKDLLLSSVNFHYDENPTRGAYKIWYTKDRTIQELGYAVISVVGQQSLADHPDWNLLETNPSAWLAKYVP